MVRVVSHSVYLNPQVNMASNAATDAVLSTPMTKNRFLKVNKEGVPLNKQVPSTSQVNTVTTGAVALDGSSNFWVLNALVGALAVNIPSAANLINRTIDVLVRGGVGQNVVLTFPAAGYPVYVDGASGASANYTIAANANNQNVRLIFGPTAGYVMI